MGVDTSAQQVKRRHAAPMQSDASLDSAPAECAEIAAALAVKLACRRVVLAGCAREWIVEALRPLVETVEIDPQALARRVDEIELSLLLLDARVLLEDPGFAAELRALAETFVAALVIDPDGGLGIEAVSAIVAAAQDAGLQVEHRSLVRSPGRSSYRRESPLVVLSSGQDPRVGFALAAGARGFALDPLVDLAADLDRPARICVASYEVVGPTRNGGIGTANTSLALALARAGHDVTLLFTGVPDGESEIEGRKWQRQYSRQGVRFAVLDKGRSSTVRAPHLNVRRAYELYRWLAEHDRAEPFDVVHFPECQGHGYYAVLARRQRLAFAHTLFVAGVHSSTRWCVEANRELPRSLDALVDEHLERLSVELADAVVSPSAYMLDYMRTRGWKLPKRAFVQQYILPPTARPRPGLPPRREHDPIEELVFFGRLEVRKGIDAFCDALDRLVDIPELRDLTVRFMGRPEHVRGEPAVEYLRRRSKRWPWPYELTGNIDQQQALAQLRRRRCLAVMPSTVDNSPNTVSEVLSLRIPMIASRSGGTGELIDPLDLALVTFPGLHPRHGLPPDPAERIASEVDAGELAERIVAALRAPVVPRFAVDHDRNEHIHVGWNVGMASLAQRGAASDGSARVVARLPRVTVGILHRDDGDGLMEALRSVAEQEDQVGDVVVVDDASATAEGLGKLAWAEEFCRPRGWSVIRRERPHAGAAREQMIAAGSGELFVMMRGAESLAPGALATLRAIARRGRADVLSWPTADPRRCYDDQGADDGASLPLLVPVGGPALAGLLYPAFACGPYAITRASLERLHGFASDAAGPDADHDLLNRALLSGEQLEVIVQPLAVVQAADEWASLRRAFTVDLGECALDREQAVRIARPFAALAPAELIDLPALLLTLQAKTAGERLRAITAHEELDTTRRQHGEYIAYLEAEHHKLSVAVRELQRAVEQAPHRRARAVLGRVKRKLL